MSAFWSGLSAEDGACVASEQQLIQQELWHLRALAAASIADCYDQCLVFKVPTMGRKFGMKHLDDVL